VTSAEPGDLRTAEIEAAAAEVLDEVAPWIWDGERLPVPVETIVDSCFGLLVRDIPQAELAAVSGAPRLAAGQALSGLLLAGEREIWVNEAEARRWPTRRRFTIGHELGHWVLHHDPDGANVFCRAATVEAGEPAKAPERPPLPVPEAEANAFAAALLMPAHLVEAHYRRGGDFQALCRRFGSSGAAMGRRLHRVIPPQR
jgi:hypothetical protein